jgi:hypothetical protein
MRNDLDWLDAVIDEIMSQNKISEEELAEFVAANPLLS